MDIEVTAREQGFAVVDGVLFDLGLSYWELSYLEKGLSFTRPNEPLDMRLGESEETAAEILARSSEDELYAIFSENSEEIRSRAIAHIIVEMRKNRAQKTVQDLTETIDKVIGQPDRKVYARIFQALRMHVNHEKENLTKGIEGAVKLLKQGGRIAVISFHSVEDRLVKRLMEKNGLKLVMKKTPAYGDQKFERSATLRIGEKTS